MILSTIVSVLFLKCFGGLIIGFAIHTLIKYNEATELFIKGNIQDEKLTLIGYLKKKPWSHGLNLICVLSWLLFLPDIIESVPLIKGSQAYANIVHIAGCFVIGYANSSLILKALGTGTKYAMDVIDKKTNIADGK